MIKKKIMIQAVKKDREYFRIHNWLSYNYGAANKCEAVSCKSKSPKRFEWALIKGKEYKKDRTHFIMMCPSCHRKYDFTETQRINQSLSAKGRTFSQETKLKLSIANIGVGNKSIVQKDRAGKIIAEYDSVSIAAEKTGISQSAISNVLTNRAKTSGGFIWQYRQMN